MIELQLLLPVSPGFLSSADTVDAGVFAADGAAAAVAVVGSCSVCVGMLILDWRRSWPIW